MPEIVVGPVALNAKALVVAVPPLLLVTVLTSVNRGTNMFETAQVMTAPAFTLVAAIVITCPEIEAEKLAGFPDTAEFESVHVADAPVISQPDGPVSVTVVNVLTIPRMLKGPVTGTPDAVVVTEVDVVP